MARPLHETSQALSVWLPYPLLDQVDRAAAAARAAAHEPASAAAAAAAQIAELRAAFRRRFDAYLADVGRVSDILEATVTAAF